MTSEDDGAAAQRAALGGGAASGRGWRDRLHLRGPGYPAVRRAAGALRPRRPARPAAAPLPTLDQLLTDVRSRPGAAPAPGPTPRSAQHAGVTSTASRSSTPPATRDASGPDVGDQPGPAAREDLAVAAPAAAQEGSGPEPAGARPEQGAASPAHGATALDSGQVPRFGRPGRAFSREHPFYIGFVGALGVLVAYALVQMLGQLAPVITLLVVSLFLALGLEPVVHWLQERGLPRAGAIALVFSVVVALVAGFAAAVVPLLISQGTELAAEVPQILQDIQRSQWFTDLDARYDIVGRMTEEVESFFSGDRVAVLFGGVFGAGKAVVSGVFSTFTVLVLTLYFLASLRNLRTATYRLVPRSRRLRVQLLGDEISRRIGGYVIGQISIASINAAASYLMMLIVGIPYALVLAVIVGIFGLIPLVGATLGALIVVAVALFTSVTDAVVVGAYYVAYQQFENYVIVPRIMQRTVAVPGGVVIVAALAGASLFGVIGALIAIPLAAGVLLVVQEVLMPRQDRS